MKRDRKKGDQSSNKRVKQNDGKKGHDRNSAASLDKKADSKKEHDHLSKLVMVSNSKQVERGNQILFHDIPDKIEELTEYINVSIVCEDQLQHEPLFHISFEELRNEICVDQKIYEEYAKKINKKFTEYKKESRKVFDKWRQESRSVCSEIIKTLHSGAPRPKETYHSKDILYNSKYEFPLNEVLFVCFYDH